MAVPPEFTTFDISGTYVLNKSQSDDTDEILRLQGVGWFTRKAIGLATITLSVKHYKDDDGKEHIDIGTTLTGGIKGTTENRTLDWDRRTHEDHVFGSVIGQSRRVKAEDVESEFLKNGWSQDTVEHGLINAYGESDTPKSGLSWVANQTWGFEEIDGERKYVRHVDFTGTDGEKVQARMVYDYYGAP
ncbi:hypothetical protein EVG20_g1521 [Dentipellis fragilis]|uniref:Uncharacterized protein n=1 Tax=Dentipellis fragilis TaxID=205917 RepID=A0A4Y9ZAL9_9AGAM|nr:hypothetical protein EVG20_g1521 [Dentipellis fragilis]